MRLLALAVAFGMAALCQAPVARAEGPGLQSDAKATAPAKKRRERVGAWLNLGLNWSSVERSDYNCYGGQYGFGIGRTVYLRLQRTSVTYEAKDRTGTCDGLFAGDSSAVEKAATVGLMLGRSGLFFGAGPARVEFEENYLTAGGSDTGTRFEAGWTSRKKAPGFLGIEVLLFRTANEVRDYGGLAFNVTFGLRW